MHVFMLVSSSAHLVAFLCRVCAHTHTHACLLLAASGPRCGFVRCRFVRSVVLGALQFFWSWDWMLLCICCQTLWPMVASIFCLIARGKCELFVQVVRGFHASCLQAVF